MLDHYVHAIGGRDAWIKLNSRVSKGTIEIPAMNNLSGSVEIHKKAPNSMLAVIKLGGAVFEQGFDGTMAWSDDPQNGLASFGGAELDDAKREANFYHPLDLQEVVFEDDGHRRRKKSTSTTPTWWRRFDWAEAIRTRCISTRKDGYWCGAINHRNTPDGLAEFTAEVRITRRWTG